MSLAEADRSIQDTALWALLKQKTESEALPTEFMAGVSEVCGHGITLAKDIIRFFPAFTLHDNVHICNVCDWMYQLLGGHAEKITAADAALLVMSAACHDLGMSVSGDQKAELVRAAQKGSAEWERFFSNHPGEYEEFQRTGEVSDKMLRNYVRLHHHERVGLQFPRGMTWPRALTAGGISKDVFLRLCKSHGEPIEALSLKAADQRSRKYHLLPCAILLRLADLLDFDASRAPEDLYHHLGLDHPKDTETAFSKMEWDENCTSHHFELVGGILSFQAECTSMQVEHQVRAYMDWLQRELDECSRALSGRELCWDGFQPPYKVEVEIQADGYKSGPFCLTMEQDRILELLAGKNLYSDPGVFVRELLQNSIDAVRTRVAQDPAFQLEQGRIVIHTWMDSSGYSWFRIEDNGTGMDEEIILNHFLKVGSSFYNSDRFKTELRKCKAKDRYMPISRFGIGILSCFMSDPEHNKLQLSTKRFAQAGSTAPAAIRMNVDGLHGYYYLAEEGAQVIESELLTMDHPLDEGDEENCYRSEAGTAICVRLNLYQLGGVRTLKELVDRYVQFPEIRVEYHGQEGDITYPTQQELMDQVHSLNPDGEHQPPKKHCYYISDEDFDRLKQEHPEIVWETDEKPGIALQYCPLDWMAPGDQVSGVAVIAEIIEPKYHIFWPWSDESPFIEFDLSYDASSQRVMVNVTAVFPLEIRKQIEAARRTIRTERTLLDMYPRCHDDPKWCQRFSEQYGVQLEEIPRLYREAEKRKNEYADKRNMVDTYRRARKRFWMYFPYSELSTDCPLVNALPDYLQVCGHTSVKSRTISAFNGVLADQSPLLGENNGFVGMILLLQQNYRPEVNLARDTISSLPLEAMAVLSVLQKKLRFRFGYRECPEAFRPSRFFLKTEQELHALLDELPALKDELSIGPHTLYEAEELVKKGEILQLSDCHKDSLYDILCLAAAKQLGTVSKDFNSNSNSNLCGTANDKAAASFPAALFFAPERENAALGEVWGSLCNYYNQEHPFSQWLIAHQKELQEKVPGIYNALLEDMVLVRGEEELLERLNDGLRRLQGLPGNPYHVTDDLFLKETDFA